MANTNSTVNQYVKNSKARTYVPGDKMNIVVFRQLTDGWHAFNYEVVMNA